MLNEQLQRIVLGVLTSFLATFGGCLSTGCATRVTGIGAVSERPLFTFDGFGVKIAVHSLEATFEHDVEAGTE